MVSYPGDYEIKKKVKVTRDAKRENLCFTFLDILKFTFPPKHLKACHTCAETIFLKDRPPTWSLQIKIPLVDLSAMSM
jgi:hypothetical protein